MNIFRLNLRKRSWLPIGAAILQAFLFVLMGVWIRMMNRSFNTPQQVFWRMLIASGLAWIVFGRFFSRRLLAKLTRRDWSIYALRAALNYGVGVIFFTIAINRINLSTVSFVSALPIIGVLAMIMFKEKFDRRAVPFVIISVFGLVLTTGLTLHKLDVGFGSIAALIGTLGFDISWLMVRYHPKKMTNFHNTTLMLSFAWIIPLAIILVTGDTILPSSISQTALIGLIASAILNVAGLFILNYIFTELKGYVAGNLLLLEGVFAIVIGYFFYNETSSLLQLAGALIIVSCAIAISKISLSTKTISEKL